jgi:ferredoxin
MRAVIDLAACQAYANCVIEAPEIFDLHESTGKVIVLIDEIPDDLAEEARRAAASCPVKAIEFEG